MPKKHIGKSPLTALRYAYNAVTNSENGSKEETKAINGLWNAVSAILGRPGVLAVAKKEAIRNQSKLLFEITESITYLLIYHCGNDDTADKVVQNSKKLLDMWDACMDVLVAQRLSRTKNTVKTFDLAYIVANEIFEEIVADRRDNNPTDSEALVINAVEAVTSDFTARITAQYNKILKKTL